jgi:hypothetical protein
MKKSLIILSGAMFLTIGTAMAQQMPSSSDTTGIYQTPTGVKHGDNSDLYRKDQSGNINHQGDHQYNSSTRQTDSIGNQSGTGRRRRSDSSMTPGNQYRSPVDSTSNSGRSNSSSVPSGSSTNGSSTGTDVNGTSGTGTQPKPAGGQ